jgi:hypothetical protein
MTTPFIRRDIALRGAFYIWLLLSIFVGITLAIAGKTISIDPGINSFNVPSTGNVSVYALVVSWILLSLYLGPAEVADHCNRMTITLPVPVKTLWLSRVFALTIAETVLFVVTGLVIVCTNLGTGSSALFPTFLVKFLILQFSCILLLIAVIQSLDIRRIAMPSTFRSYAILILVWIAAGVLLYVLVQYPIHFALIPIAMAAIIFLTTLSRLPASFTTEPQTQSKANPLDARLPVQSPGWLSRAKSRRIVWITLFGTLYNPWFSPLFLLALGILAMANMDYTLRNRDHISMVLGIWMFMFLLLFIAIQQLYKLDHLPISRRIIYACLVLPCMGVILVMSIVGIGAARYSASPNALLVPWVRVLPLNLVLILLSWFIMQSFIFAAPRASGLRARLSILTAVCALGYIATLLFRFSGDFSSNLLNISVGDLSSKIPIETLVLWILAILTLVSGYFITERFFKSASLASMRKYQ